MVEEIEKGYAGETLEDFLKEQGIYEEVTASALASVRAWQAEQEAKKVKAMSKVGGFVTYVQGY